MNANPEQDSIPRLMDELGRSARAAAGALARSTLEQRNTALSKAAAAIRERSAGILAANDKDMASAREKSLGAAMLDRLALDESRIESIATGLETVRDLPDPLGKVLAEWERPSGLRISRVSVPLGVIGIIYESRPNVTAVAAGPRVFIPAARFTTAWSQAWRQRISIGRPCSWCQPPTALQLVTCCRRWRLTWTSSCRAAARA
jgi:hypothetical protein